MSGIGRISFIQGFSDVRENILRSQSSYVTSSLQLNSGERILEISEDPEAVKELTVLGNQVLESEEIAGIKSSTESLLEISERAIGDIKNLVDQIKTDALFASNTTANAKDREAFGDVLQSTVENIFTLANSRLNGQYLFSGKQSDKKTVDFDENDIFANIQYLEGEQDAGPKELYNLQSSVRLDTIFNSTAAPAVIQSSNAVTLPITDGGDIRLVINDGNGNVYDTGDINIPAATNPIANVITIINGAVNAAGLQGAIVQENPVGSLEFNTSLITNSINNESASITISNGSTVNATTVLEDFNIIGQKATGESQSLQDTLEDLFNAYNANDVDSIRASIVDIDANLERLVGKQTLTGTLINQFQDSRFADEDRVTSLKLKKSAVQDMPIAEAIVEANQAKLIMDTLLRNATTVVNASIFNFVNF
ncbi:MAG: hypothetical protein HRT47_04755 [Candidatus Caenarcaniphilales bacterium]|nr:hypothetical protein [Candidatus Caenarcaniphilales bacterium]